MNKKVVVVSHREIPVSDGMNNSYYSNNLETFFFGNKRCGKAPVDVYLRKARELAKKFNINNIEIGDGWELDDTYVKLDSLLATDSEKKIELETWYKEMNNYPISEIDRSILCEDFFDDHLDKNKMTIQNRCSVWEHKDSNGDYAFYAVFPLKSANPGWLVALINAIKEKNENSVVEILFLLHDHDLFNDKNRPFQLVKDTNILSSLKDKDIEGLTITVAVFQHVDNEMNFLVNENHNPEEIFKHYSDILYEKPKIMEARANNIVYKGYQKLLNKTQPR